MSELISMAKTGDWSVAFCAVAGRRRLLTPARMLYTVGNGRVRLQGGRLRRPGILSGGSGTNGAGGAAEASRPRILRLFGSPARWAVRPTGDPAARPGGKQRRFPDLQSTVQHPGEGRSADFEGARFACRARRLAAPAAHSR